MKAIDLLIREYELELLLIEARETFFMSLVTGGVVAYVALSYAFGVSMADTLLPEHTILGWLIR